MTLVSVWPDEVKICSLRKLMWSSGQDTSLIFLHQPHLRDRDPEGALGVSSKAICNYIKI